MPRLTAVNSAGYAAPAALTADPVILAPLSGRLHVLLVRRAEPPQEGRWALPGGFMNDDELPEQTAQRKLTEKTGVGGVYLEQLHTYGDPTRDPRGWIVSISYLALIDAAVLHDDGATTARWFPVDDLPEVAFDHGDMIAEGTERLRGKLWYSNIAVGLLPERFTMPQARRLYEAISGVSYEASNFRRELEQSGLVRSTGEVVKGVPGRPAMLYEFVERRPAWSPRRSRTPAAIRAGTGGSLWGNRPPGDRL
ncbi:MAG TPA: NUDIX domain-containing protein [Candidatus Dormibacteraeota bacterium]|jgi:8-oxo-dGTP diphosphatase|nr:NUDIX domain-containing protein [Candidatus Dormibacteraeota bacterium]